MDENKNIPLNDNSASQENNPAKPLPSQQPKGADLEKMVREMFDGPEQKSTASTNKNSLFAKTVTEPKSDSFFKQFILPKFHLSFGKKNPVVTGLDIGTSAIKCVTFACEPTGPEFISMDMEEIAHENFEAASRNEVIRDCIRKLQSRKALQDKIYVASNLPNLLVEFMYLPVMPPDELNKAIRWDAKEKLLVDEENYVIDYLCLGQINIAQQAQEEILFFAVPKKDIMDTYQLLTSLGVRPLAVRPNFLASFQAFQNKSVWRDDETVGFLDIGASATQFSIVTSGYIHFNRRFSVSGDSITRSIADYCRISYEEAERAKRDFGMSRMALEEDRKDDTVSEQPRVRISHAMGLHLDQIITEIQHTFNYFSLQVSNTKVAKMDRLIITGGGALTKGIGDFFKNRLEMPVEIVNPFSHIKTNMKNLDAALLENRGARFSTAVGMALSECP